MNICKEHEQIIWMIDDDHIQHFCVEKSLQLQGTTKHMISFFDGEEAIIFFNQHIDDHSLLPDIIFLDLNMPHVNGWQFLKQYASIKQNIEKQIKIYVLSSSINKEEINRAISLPEVEGFFSKPIKPDEISKVLNQCSQE